MRNAQRRLAQLETQFQGRWPVEVETAKARVLARVQLKISVALDAMGHPACKADAALLADDTPEQAAADTAILQRWARQHSSTLYPDDSAARDCVAAKLEEMARRLQAGKDNDEPEDTA